MVDESLERVKRGTMPWLGALALPCVLYAIAKVTLEKMTEMHWTLGLATAVLFACGGQLLILVVFREIRKRTQISLIVGQFLAAVAVSIVVFAWISYALHSFAHVPYTSSIRDLGTVSAFCDLYAWIFLDLIPGLEMWETLHVPCPIQSGSLVAALPELLFKASVVVPLLAAITLWLEMRKERGAKSAVSA